MAEPLATTIGLAALESLLSLLESADPEALELALGPMVELPREAPSVAEEREHVD